MADNFGIGFMPPAQRVPGQRPGEPALGPAQRAIQTLSLQLPRVLGARSIAPQSLLTPRQGGGGGLDPESAVLQTVLRTMAPSLPSPAQPSPGATSVVGMPPMPQMAPPSPLAPMSGASPLASAPAPASSPFAPQGPNTNEIEEFLAAILRRLVAPAPGPNIIPGVGGPEEPGPIPGPPPMPPPEPGPSVPEEPGSRFPEESAYPLAAEGGMDALLRMFR